MINKHKPAVSNESLFPRIGTVFDEGRLQLVSAIGTGGYGVVYQAIDIRSSTHESYAVKCLARTDDQRQSHIREIALHKLVSSHPGVITLHKVVEEDIYFYLVMEYAPDQDLFIQILHNCRYLGNDVLIKDVFLQLLDAVEYCHSLGIYHRDLKPENVVCFENGLRLALTDFGLATTQRTSAEFKTGSAYHMSPECQTSEATYEGIYSPQSCDIWSLGIVLLNIVTGRNPWKSANQEDTTFLSYRRNPYFFLPEILPISSELNDVLIMMLSIEWRARPTISDIRAALNQVETFYSKDVVFEGNVARCSWESGMDLGTGTHEPNVKVKIPRRPREDAVTQRRTLHDSFGEEISGELSSSEGEDESFDESQDASYSSSQLPVSPSISSLPAQDPLPPPITPGKTISSFEQDSISSRRSPLNSFISGLQNFFRFCSSSRSL